MDPNGLARRALERLQAGPPEGFVVIYFDVDGSEIRREPDPPPPNPEHVIHVQFYEKALHDEP